MKKLFKHAQKVGQSFLSRRDLPFFKVLSSFLLVNLFTFSLFGAPLEALQNMKVTIKENNAPLSKIINEIEKQTDYSIIIRLNDVDLKKTTTLNVNSEEIDKVLDKVFAKMDVRYEIEGNTISIYKENEKYSVQQSQPLRKIRGVIKSSDSEPLIGARISLKNKKTGVVTDIDGNFELEAQGTDFIEVSYLGYTTQLIKADKANYNIVLLEDTRLLDEVVVVGYGTQRVTNLSGSVGSVSAKKLVNRSVLNMGQALQGTIANLNVNVSSGQSIKNPTFNIRGTTTLTEGSGAPLIVIDGVIADAGQLNRMNPTDVESFSILKDASSSAIYGSRAAFGVILVTTKSGKVEGLTINYNNNFASRQVTRMPEALTDPYEVARIRNIMGAPWYHSYDDDKLAYAKRVSEDPSLSPYLLNPDGTYSYFGQTDWVKEAYKSSGFSTNHTLDISGKSDRLAYYFSGGYDYNDGMIRYGTDIYNRYNLRSKLDFKINDNWTLSNNTRLTTSAYRAPTNLGSSYYWEINRVNPLDVVRNPDGTWTSNGASVLGLLEEGGKWKEYATTISTNFNSRYDILKNELFVQGVFSYTNDRNDRKWHYLPVEYYDGPEREPKYKSSVSSAYADYASTRHFQTDLYVTYNKTFAEKHAVNAVLGYTQEESRYEYRSLSRKDLISTTLPSLSLATGEMNMGEDITTWAVRSGFGRFNYTFDDKYILEFSARYDGTSRFRKDSRFIFSPSGSLAWVISREKFFEPLLNVVSLLKPRVSYGKLGNQDIKDRYAYLARMKHAKTGRILDGEKPVYVGAPGLVSGNLTWESVSTLNFGLDLNLLNNRFTLSADMYERRTKDMLMAGETLPGVLGTSVPMANAADLKTKGWELTAGWRDAFTLRGKPFNYGVNFNIADSYAEITKFENPKGLLDNRYVGQRVGERWGLTTLGFFTSQEDIDNHANQIPVTSYPGSRPIEPGDLKFFDRDGSGTIDRGAWTLKDHGDYHIIGNTTSRYTYGLTTTAEWNGVDISCFFQGVGKKDYFPGGGDTFFWGTYYEPWSNITMGNYLDHWTEETPNAYFPRLKSYLSYVGNADAAISQTRYKQDASYIRLKNLTVGYSFPTQLVRKMSLERLRVYFSGDNLLVKSGLYKYYKIDPELLSGQDYPLQRSFSLGVNVTF